MSFSSTSLTNLSNAVSGLSNSCSAKGSNEEAYLFQQLLRTEEAPVAMRRFLEIGGQTREGELRVNELSAEIGADAGSQSEG